MLFAAQVGIAGSTVVEDDVVLAGQVGVAGHIRIGKGVVATAQTGVPNSIDAGEFVSGYPAIANRDWLKSSAIFRHLPDVKKRVADLEQRIAELEEKLDACLTAVGSLIPRLAALAAALLFGVADAARAQEPLAGRRSSWSSCPASTSTSTAPG